VNKVLDGMQEAVKNKAEYCRKLVPVLVDQGTIEKRATP
jgi:hypothetical protein